MLVSKIEKLHEYGSTHSSHKDAQIGYCLPRIHMLGTNKKPCLKRRFVISWVLGGWYHISPIAKWRRYAAPRIKACNPRQ